MRCTNPPPFPLALTDHRGTSRLASLAFLTALAWPLAGWTGEHAPEEAQHDATPDSPRGESHGEGHAKAHGEAQAEAHGEAHGQGHHGGVHEVHHRYLAGVFGVVLGALAEEGTTAHVGVGAFFEMLVIPNWLEIELSTRVLSAETGVELPIELLFKKPFHLTHWFHPFIGIGPALVPAFLEEGNSVHGGGASTIGAYFWLTSDLALLAEFNYNLIYDKGLVHELGGSFGALLGW